jgi:hypothetical protein
MESSQSGESYAMTRAKVKELHGHRRKVTETHVAANNNPRRTYNSRKSGRLTCSGATRADASRLDSTATHLRRKRRKPAHFAKARRIQTRLAANPPGPRMVPSPRRVPRPDGYNTLACRGKAEEREGIGIRAWGIAGAEAVVENDALVGAEMERTDRFELKPM